MKHSLLTLLAALGTLALGACVADTDGDDGQDLTPGSELISFGAVLKRVATADTRMNGTTFTAGDQVSLYAVPAAAQGGLTGRRYVSNLRLVHNGDGMLVPDRSVFWPEDGSALSFTAIHPYQAQGIAEGQHAVTHTVAADQRTADAWTQSDLLVAVRPAVDPQQTAVQLSFAHYFARLLITLTPPAGTTAAELAAASPTVLATGFATTATLNVDALTLGDASAVADIIPHGSWSAAEGLVTGVQLLVPPQAIGPGQTLQMEWAGRVYTVPMPSVTLDAGTQRTLTVQCSAYAGSTLSGVAGEVEPWTDGEPVESGSTLGLTAIHPAVLGFADTGVYRVIREGLPVAEICREWVDLLGCTATTVYPVGSDGLTDLTQGLIVGVAQGGPAVCGSTISWQGSQATLTEPAALPAVEAFWVDAEGRLTLSAPEDPLPCNVVAHYMTDVRGTDVTRYGVQKLGRTFWAWRPLCTLRKADGSALTVAATGADPDPAVPRAYLLSGTADSPVATAYTLAALEGLIPQSSDWRMALRADYEDAIAAVTDHANLKQGTWQKVDGKADWTRSTGAAAVGFLPYGCINAAGELTNAGKGCYYWAVTDGSAVFNAASNKERALVQASSGTERAYQVRLVRK